MSPTPDRDPAASPQGQRWSDASRRPDSPEARRAAGKDSRSSSLRRYDALLDDVSSGYGPWSREESGDLPVHGGVRSVSMDAEDLSGSEVHFGDGTSKAIRHLDTHERDSLRLYFETNHRDNERLLGHARRATTRDASGVIEFLAIAILSGVIGTAASDMLKAKIRAVREQWTLMSRQAQERYARQIALLMVKEKLESPTNLVLSECKLHGDYWQIVVTGAGKTYRVGVHVDRPDTTTISIDL